MKLNDIRKGREKRPKYTEKTIPATEYTDYKDNL